MTQADPQPTPRSESEASFLMAPAPRGTGLWRRRIVGPIAWLALPSLLLLPMMRAAALPPHAFELSAILLLTVLPALFAPLAVRGARDLRGFARDLARLTAPLAGLLLAALLLLGWMPGFMLFLSAMHLGWWSVARVLAAFGLGASARSLACFLLCALSCSTIYLGNGPLAALDTASADHLRIWLMDANLIASAAGEYAGVNLLTTPLVYLSATSALNDHSIVVSYTPAEEQLWRALMLVACAFALAALPRRAARSGAAAATAKDGVFDARSSTVLEREGL